jgi:translation initiation factor 2 gamma subunit (eIF-2gamma)
MSSDEALAKAAMEHSITLQQAIDTLKREKIPQAEEELKKFLKANTGGRR